MIAPNDLEEVKKFVGKLDFSEASINEIVALRNEAESLIGQGGAGVDNILGEFCETCDSIVYKLKRLI